MTTPTHREIFERVKRAVDSGHCIILSVRVEGGDVHCDCDWIDFPSEDDAAAAKLIAGELQKMRQKHDGHEYDSTSGS